MENVLLWKMGREKGTLTVTVNKKLLEKLEKARVQGDYKVSRSQIVEKALEEYLKKEGKKWVKNYYKETS